jgi:hypothetical protein
MPAARLAAILRLAWPAVSAAQPFSVTVEMPGGWPRSGAEFLLDRDEPGVRLLDSSGALLAKIREHPPLADPEPTAPDPSAETVAAHATAALESLRQGRLNAAFGRDFARSAAAVWPPSPAQVAPPTVDRITALRAPETLPGMAHAILTAIGDDPIEHVVAATLELGAILTVATGLTLDRDGWQFQPAAANAIRVTQMRPPQGVIEVFVGEETKHLFRSCVRFSF